MAQQAWSLRTPSRPVQVFPAKAQRETVGRLCILFNVLHTLQILIETVFGKDPPGRMGGLAFKGHRLCTFLFTVGVCKEGADELRHSRAFLDKLLDEMKSKSDGFAPAFEAWQRIRCAIDRDDPTSLYSRAIKPIRDKAAFHWSRAEIDRVWQLLAVDGASQEVLFLGPTPKSTRFCFADEILTRLAFPHEDHSRNQELISEMARFVGDVVRLLAAAVPFVFQTQGCEAVAIPPEAEF